MALGEFFLRQRLQTSINILRGIEDSEPKGESHLQRAAGRKGRIPGSRGKRRKRPCRFDLDTGVGVWVKKDNAHTAAGNTPQHFINELLEEGVNFQEREFFLKGLDSIGLLGGWNRFRRAVLLCGKNDLPDRECQAAGHSAGRGWDKVQGLGRTAAEPGRTAAPRRDS